MRIRCFSLFLVVAALAGCGPAVSAGPIAARPRLAADDLSRVLLSADDLPAGWTRLMAGTGDAATQISGCGSSTSTVRRQAAVAFSRGPLGPFLAEALASTPAARAAVDNLRQVISECAQVAAWPLDVPPMGDDSTAFAIEAGIPGVGIALHGQVVAVCRGDALLTVTVVGMSTIDTSTTVAAARAALAKLP
jgi:hypothetical protein